jgi:hypothetical protein
VALGRRPCRWPSGATASWLSSWARTWRAAARRNLAASDAVEVVTGAFDEWPLPGEPFDVVFSATAFHWIDPAVRVSKSANALRLGGLRATVGTHHAGGTDVRTSYGHPR